MARFNIISKVENNDFDRSIEFGLIDQKNQLKKYSSYNANYLGIIFSNLGQYSHSLKYHNKALEIDTELNDRVGLSGDYNNIGEAYPDKGQHDEALKYHNKALE